MDSKKNDIKGKKLTKKPEPPKEEIRKHSAYEIVNTVKGRALGRVVTLENTLEQCHRVMSQRIPGDFVECGVYAGVHVALMAHAARTAFDPLGRQRAVHAFDSFEGIPHAGPKDDETITELIGTKYDKPGKQTTTGISACSLDQVKKNMREWGINEDAVTYHPGWFKDTVPTAAPNFGPNSIAVLRLDGDLYESTKVCLEELHPYVRSGGTVIIDDYALTGCREALEEYLGGHGIKVEMNVIEGGGGPAWYMKP